MRYLSVCSGIEAATVAWHPLGMTPAAFSEIEGFPSAVLAYHYPDVPNLGDMTKFKDWPDADIDVLVGGTPCQSFSVAGLRAGLADPRGNLALVYLAIAARYRPRWLVWENVPGVRSSGEGRDFGAFLGGLGQLGYGWAYRSFDAQYFGLAQRRERVFVVGSLGGWRSAAAVLFEREGLRGDLAPRRQAGEIVANSLVDRPDRGGGNSEGQRLIAQSLTANGVGTCGADDNQAQAGHLIAHSLNAHSGRIDGESETFIAHTFEADGFDASEDGTGRGIPLVTVAATLSAGNNANSNAAGRRREDDFNLVAFARNQRDEVRQMDVAGALAKEAGMKQQTYVNYNGVRRLTPRECERLQGFPDDYTLVPYKRKPAKDSPRYKALGNSMAVPCMAWIGKRLMRTARSARAERSKVRSR